MLIATMEFISRVSYVQCFKSQIFCLYWHHSFFLLKKKTAFVMCPLALERQMVKQYYFLLRECFTLLVPVEGSNCWFQLLKRRALLLFFVLYDSKWKVWNLVKKEAIWRHLFWTLGNCAEHFSQFCLTFYSTINQLILKIICRLINSKNNH